MITAVHRKIDDDELDFMREEAYAGGIDLSHYFHQRDYRIEANLFLSEVSGSPEAILEAQESSARYYQRPDNDYVTLDPTRTSLSGHAGSLRLTRTSNHQLVFQSGVAWRSPGFEINDLGFMRAADGINQFNWVAYERRNPIKIFDRFAVNGNQTNNWDYGGNYLGSRFNINANAQFRNKVQAGFAITREPEQVSNTRLRGGPSSKWPGEWSYEVWGNSDRRKRLSFNAGAFVRRGDEASVDEESVWAGITWRPTDAIRFSLNPELNRSQREMQYIDTLAFGFDDRFIFGTIDQETTVLNLRLDYSITPDLTVQLYASPFVSTGRYSNLKRITSSRAGRYRDRFDVFDADQIIFDEGNEAFDIDENRDGIVDYSLDDPEFDVREFNSNLVIRWEYRPGSAIFLVWSQVRDESTLNRGRLDFRDELDQLFSAPAEDVILLKVSKWFSP